MPVAVAADDVHAGRDSGHVATNHQVGRSATGALCRPVCTRLWGLACHAMVTVRLMLFSPLASLATHQVRTRSATQITPTNQNAKRDPKACSETTAQTKVIPETSRP